ncbi:MAG: hypothetical protein K2X11_18365 [Acetobacteraceae bacterium]|nr:hypothetical protein [Acetobacteraceae bacterium]
MDYRRCLEEAKNDEALLVSIYAYFDANRELDRIGHAQALALRGTEILGNEASAAFRAVIFEQLQNGLRSVTDAKFLFDDGIVLRPTATGFLRVQELAGDMQETVGWPTDRLQLNIIPASDRLVRLDDNDPNRTTAVEGIEKIEHALTTGANDLPLDAEERRVAADELKSLRSRLQRGWIRAGELSHAVTKGSVVVWLLDKLAAHALNAVLLAVMGALLAISRLAVG